MFKFLCPLFLLFFTFFSVSAHADSRRNGNRLFFSGMVEYFLTHVEEVWEMARTEKQYYRTIPQIDIFSRTVTDRVLTTTSSGAGLGVRVEVYPSKTGTFSLQLLPMLFEYHAYKETDTRREITSDIRLRTSGAVSYVRKLTNKTKVGAKVSYYPQLIDLGQYQVYVETYVRYKAFQSKATEIIIIPKMVYWKTNDELSEVQGVVPTNSEVSLFCNMEFRFHL